MSLASKYRVLKGGLSLLQRLRGLVIDNARNIDTSGLTLRVSEGEPIVRK